MQYITTQTLFRIKLLLLTGTIVIVAIVLIDVISNNSSPIGTLGKKGSKAIQDELKKSDDLLHAKLWQLQDMDQQFASLLTSRYDQAAIAKTNASIQYAEESFRKSIDSIARIGSTYDEESQTNDFQNMATFFKKILENRRFIAFTRMGILSGSQGPASERQTILKLQNELYEKDKMIASSASNKTVINLQNQLGEKDKQILALETRIQQDQAEKQAFTQTTQKLQADLAQKDKLIADLGNKKTSPDQKALLNLQNELNGKNQQISTLQAQSQSEKQNYTQTIQKLQSELSEKNKTIAATTNKKLPADQNALASLQNEINIKTKQINDLQTQMQKEQSEKKGYSQAIQKYQSDIAQKNKMIDALSNIKIPTDDKAIASLQKEISAKNRQITDLQTELNQKNKTIASTSGNKGQADQKGLASLQNDLAAKNNQISTLQAEVRKERTEKQTFAETIHDLQLELIDKNKIIASAGNRKVSTDQKALVTLQNEIAEKDKRIKRLEDQILNSPIFNRTTGGESAKDLEQRNSNLRLAYNNTMTQLGVLQKKYNSLKAEMDQMKTQR